MDTESPYIYAMKIFSNHLLDVSSPKPSASEYEWWYFDGRDDRGEYQFVVIFYEGCPFSPQYIRQAYKHPEHILAKAESHPAVSISVYRNGKTVYYSMSEYSPSESTFSREKISLRIGNHTMEGFIENEQMVYSLRLDETLPSGDRISGLLRYISPKPNPSLWGASATNETSSHSWNLIQPLAQVKGVLSVASANKHEKPIVFEGVGYHDHNIGSEPMKNEFRDWYWGRIHFNDFTLVYYIMNTVKGQQYNAWLISPDNQRVLDSARRVVADGASTNIFGLLSARRITLNFESCDITIHCRKVIDSGPFYMRFKCDAELNLKQGTGEEYSFGIAEYIRPARIHWRLFWPLVRMRYRYATKKPHWVQRTSFLYRWTW